MKAAIPRRALFAFILMASVLPTGATFTTYNDRAAFMAALGSSSATVEPFSSNLAFVVGDNLYNGINFRITGTVGGNGISGGILNGDEFTNTSVDYIFALPIFAIGADFTGAATASGLTWTINGTPFQLFSASPGTGFFGVISTDAFTTVDVSSANEIYSLDNLTYAVPEPATVAFCGFGLLSLIVLRRRGRHR